MPGDRARVSYDPSRKWRGVIAQQGRVTVEADWNEAAMIGEQRDRQVTLDVVGPAGTPDGGYTVTAHPEESEHPGRLTIGPGTLFLGGERLDLDEQVHYGAQPDWLDHSTDPMWHAHAAQHEREPRHELVYLLAAEQEVSAVEDPALADVALGGPDTMQRRRILQHFVRCRSESGTCEGSLRALERSLVGHGLTFGPASMMARSAAKLQVSFPHAAGTSKRSQPPAPGGYAGAENQMIRVMVTAIDQNTGEPTIVWGFDDASFLYRVRTATPASGSTTLTLATAPVDSFHYPAQGQAVELLRDAVKLTATDYIASPSGFVSTVTGAYQPTDKTLAISGAPAEPGQAGGYSPDYLSAEKTPQLYLRAWQATAQAAHGKTIPLGDTGVAITLTSSDGFHVGDFWHFAVRPLQPGIIYPERYLDKPQPPDGPRAWACPLAVVTWEEGEDERARVSNCVPQFSGLTELNSGKDGCCTAAIGPEDVDHGASLQALLDGYARQGAITICLEPGIYTLPAPLMLGPELDGITLQACREGAVLRARQRPGHEFALGLITIRDAASVTVRGLDLVLPLARFSPGERSFTSLHARNGRLLREFSRDLHVAIGVSAHDCADLTAEDCTFTVPDPERARLFAAGIFATGTIDGIEIVKCGFHPIDPHAGRPGRRRRRTQPEWTRTIPFHELTTGRRADPPQHLTFGYLQVPSELGRRRETRPHRLDDAVIEQCSFQGVTVPALAMAYLGALRIARNTVRDAYGGFWLISLANPGLSVMFDRIATGDADAYREISRKHGGVALLDRILAIATAIGQMLPTSGDHPEPARPLVPDAALLALAQQTFGGLYGQAAESAEAPDEIGALFTRGVPESNETTTGETGEWQSDSQDVRQDGWRPSMRLDLSDCQIDAITADSRGGAGLLIADFATRTGSALVHDNRIRGRFPGGETVFIAGIAECCVTGNIVTNESGHSPLEGTNSTLGLYAATTPPAVAVTGNVFIPPPRLRGREDVRAPLDRWDVLNTVMPYVTSATQETEIIPPAPERPAFWVLVTSGADAGRTFELHSGDMVIGREEGLQVRLEDPRISHNHAILRVRGEEVTIEDLHSTNRTRVNGVVIEHETPIAPGDQIDLGGVNLEVEQHEASSEDH
jgi:Inner membrane component of T3SS, cytoplasmic domain/Family of unknown function (DUF6519)